MRFLKQCLQALLLEPSYFFHQTPLVPRPLFRSTPLTKSLEQARFGLLITLVFSTQPKLPKILKQGQMVRIDISQDSCQNIWKMLNF